MRAPPDALPPMTPSSPTLLDRLPSLVWFFSGMLIASLVVGMLLAPAHSGDPADAFAADAATPHEPVAMVRCPSEPSPRSLLDAAACGNTEQLGALLAAGTDLSATDTRPNLSGRTALHHAVQRGDETQVALLLQAGAQPDLPDGQGNTPLHLLALNDAAPYPDTIARQLIDAGARLDVRNASGETPIEALERDHARLLERQSLALVLVRAGADTPAPTPAAPERTATPVITEPAPAAAIEPATPPLAIVEATPAPSTDIATAPTALPADTPPPAPQTDPADDVHSALMTWSAAWSAKDMPTYFASYHPGFIPENGLPHTAWVQQRQRRIGAKAGDIRVELHDIRIDVDDDRATTNFTQDYASRDYRESVRKRLEWRRSGAQWQIFQERTAD